MLAVKLELCAVRRRHERHELVWIEEHSARDRRIHLLARVTSWKCAAGLTHAPRRQKKLVEREIILRVAEALARFD